MRNSSFTELPVLGTVAPLLYCVARSRRRYLDFGFLLVSM